MTEHKNEIDHSGLESRYRVEKINDPTGKHDDCRYFVLDPQHDPIARIALRAYADEAYNAGLRQLANDLDLWANEAEPTELVASLAKEADDA